MGQHQTPLIKNQKQEAINVFNLNQGGEKMQKRVECEYVNVEGASLIRSSRCATLKR